MNSEIMKLVNNICSYNVSNICPQHNGNEFSYAEALLNLVPMMEQNRNQLHIWEIPYAENGFVYVYFYFGDITQTHREFCLEAGEHEGDLVFNLNEAITIGSSCKLYKLPKEYFLYVDCTSGKEQTMKRTVSVELLPSEANLFKAYLRRKGIRYHSSECYCNIFIQADMTEQEIKAADEFLATL